MPDEFASILNDQDLFSNPSELTSKQILARAENYVKRNLNKSPSTPVRGTAHQPQRPDFQQAYSAPALTDSGRRKRADSELPTNYPRAPFERPVSFSTYAPGVVSATSSPISTAPHLLPLPLPSRQATPNSPYRHSEDNERPVPSRQSLSVDR